MSGGLQQDLPKGETRIAPCFNMGSGRQTNVSPEGTAEARVLYRRRVSRPFGTPRDERLLGFTLLLFGYLSLFVPHQTLASDAPKIRSLAEVQNALKNHGRTIESFEVEGVVCAVLPAQK